MRVTDKGAASFNVMRRLHGRVIRRVIGIAWHVPFPAGQPLPYALSDARDDARAAILDISRGIDPKAKRKAAQAAASKQARETFGVIAEEFLADHVASLRTGKEIEAMFRKTLLPAFGARPIASITSAEIAALIKKIAKIYPHQAKRVHTYIAKLFTWMIEQGTYGLMTSPCATIKAKAICGAPATRDRVLSDTELARAWQAAAQLPAPFGPFLHVLVLSGQRLGEVAEASWDEIDLGKRLWTIPAARMKNKVAHVVPLVPQVVEILENLPRFAGPFVFSTTGGRRPINCFSVAQEEGSTLLLQASRVGGFTICGRTMRTGLSSLRVPDKVAELCISHAQPGLHKVYDKHTSLDEKREALTLWAARVMSIAGPQDDNAIRLWG